MNEVCGDTEGGRWRAEFSLFGRFLRCRCSTRCAAVSLSRAGVGKVPEKMDIYGHTEVREVLMKELPSL